MEYKKLRQTYSIKESNDEISFSGELVCNGENKLESIQGNFTLIETGVSIGNCYYTYTNSSINQNLSNINQDYTTQMTTLLDTLIKNVKTTILV